jgi:hypothetical protein
MKSRATARFWKLYGELPRETQSLADEALLFDIINLFVEVFVCEDIEGRCHLFGEERFGIIA